MAATRFGRAWRTAAAETLVNLSRMERGIGAFRRRLGARFRGAGGLIGAGLGIGAGREAFRFDRTATQIAGLRKLGLNTPEGRRASESLKAELLKVSATRGVVPGAADLLGSVQQLLEKGVPFPQALGSQLDIGRASTAFFTPVEEITSLVVSLMTTFGSSLEMTSRQIEILGAAGDRGGVELADMAVELAKVIPFARGVGIGGNLGAAQLGSLFQVAKLGTGSVEEATTRISNFLQEFGQFNTVKRIARDGGVSAFDSKGGRRPVFDIVGDIVDKLKADKSGLLASRLLTNRRSGGLLQTLAIPLEPEQQQQFGLPAGSTFFDLFEKFVSGSLADRGLVDSRIESNLASPSVRLENAFNELKDKALLAGGALDKLADFAEFATENPRTGAAIVGGGLVAAAAIPGIAAGLSGALVTRILAQQAATAATGAGGTGAAAAAGGAAAAGAGPLMALLAIPAIGAFLARSMMTEEQRAAVDEYGKFEGSRTGDPYSRAREVSIRIQDATDRGIEVKEPTPGVENQARRG